jgi:periplasmic protein TonB
MSARLAVHLPDTFSLSRVMHFPITGSSHPLNRERWKWLIWGEILAIFLGAASYGGWKVWRHVHPAPVVVHNVRFVRSVADLGVPPSLAQQVRPTIPRVDIAAAAPKPVIARPEPVPEAQAQKPTIATTTEMQEALTPVTVGDLGAGAGESLVVGEEKSPEPGDFVSVEEQPVRIRIDPPVYPDVARQAQVEGTVIVQALVGKDGRVKDCRVIDGNEMLREAAIACAKTAVFKPALMQQKPVEVWVVFPVTFKLH